MNLFDFGRRWRLAWTPVKSDYDRRIIGRWLNGKLAGRYVSLYLQYRPNLSPSEKWRPRDGS